VTGSAGIDAAGETMLVRREATANGSLVELDQVRHSSCRQATTQSGRGSLGFPQLEHESRRIVDPDTAAFVGVTPNACRLRQATEKRPD